MLSAQSPDPRPPSLWRELLLVIGPAVAAQVVIELGQTVRDALERRANRNKSKEST